MSDASKDIGMSDDLPRDPALPVPPTKPKKFNEWEDNMKIKTAKCMACDRKIRKGSSKRCKGCLRHVCSRCLSPDADPDFEPDDPLRSYYHRSAIDRVTNGCWRCNFRSGMNPKFWKEKPKPEHRGEQEYKDREAKALGKARSEAREHDGEEAELSSKPKRSSLKRKRAHPDPVDTDGPLTPEEIRPLSLTRGLRWLESERALDAKSSASLWRDISPTPGPIHQSQGVLPENLPLSNIEHLKGGSTVIVGGGIVGLFIAYELALQLQQYPIKHNVTIVEARKGICGLASGYCSGVLSTSDMPSEWSSLIGVTQQSWQQLRERADLALPVLNLDTAAVFDVTTEGSGDGESPPFWVELRNQYSLSRNDRTFGQIEPAALAKKLYEQCQLLNVDFQFGSIVHDVYFSTNAAITAVSIGAPDIEQPENFECSNLVLAAGPYTTGIFNQLFEDRTVHLENHVQSTHWFRLPLPDVADQAGSTLRFPKANEAEPQLDNDFTMRLTRSDTISITVSATARGTKARDIDTVEALDSFRDPKTPRLRKLADKYLNVGGIDVKDRSQVRLEGRAYISTANEGRPIIDRVPPSALGKVCSDEDDRNPCGVRVCFGLGRFGTTLAPGAARMLVSDVLSANGGLANDAFKLPEYLMPKGKGRAS